MTEMVYKLAKMLTIPVLTLTILGPIQRIAGKRKDLDNISDEIPGDNYPFAVISHHSGKERV